MTNAYLPIVSIVFTCLIALAAFSVLQPFLISILWAGIIAIAAWPMFLSIRRRLGGRNGRAALASTLVVALTIALPMLILGTFILRDAVRGVEFLKAVDESGLARPQWVAELPLAGEQLAAKWDEWLARPNRISQALRTTISEKLSALEDLARSVLLDVTTRVAILFFALWVLYFLFREGEDMAARVHRLGYKWLPRRWPLYAFSIPNTVHAAVNGLVLVALAECVVMSGLYKLVGAPAPVSLGTLTAVVALIPLVAPALITVVSLLLFASGHVLGGIALFLVGNVFILAAENLVRPLLAKGSSDMPFLLTLFGIFGGLALMGIAGVIIGPVILALALVLLREGEIEEDGDLEF